MRHRLLSLLAGLVLGLTAPAVAGLAVAGPVDTLPSDVATGYQPPASVGRVRREAMIPMRDGVRLHTVIVMKPGARDAPLVMERTPYGADGAAARPLSPLDAELVDDGYIRVWQDVRGRYRSEGTYVTNRPLSGPLNPTGIDHATDAADTLDWLVRNVPEANGRVGVIGGSYAGFTALMATLSGHPALKAAVPVNPMVDVWMGDDWFHHGAFRQITLPVLPILMAGRQGAPPAGGGVELYAHMLELESAGAFMRRYGLDRFPMARRFVAHPAYDAFWQAQALDRLLAAHPIRTPMLLVGGLYDEQDQYGAPAVFRALAPLDRDRRVHLLLGPWAHMGVFGDGSGLGVFRFEEDTAARARRETIKPFLDAHLKTGAPSAALAPITSYAMGGGWRRSEAIPEATRPLYLRAGGRLSAGPPESGEPARDDYVSDPARPVPVIARPFFFGSRTDGWKTSLVADQRFAAQRPDVLTYVTEPLDRPVRIFGRTQVELFAASTGADADFVVKLIDVHPDGMDDPALAGYQAPIAMDIFRGRYRRGFDRPEPLTPGRTEAFRFALPMADHVVGKGHRIMVQIQSSWFPVYDRNPQTWVADIFNAPPEAYRKATQSVVHTPAHPSAVRLPVAAE